MIREGARRLLAGMLLGVSLAVLALAMPFILLLGRRSYVVEAGSGASCLLNAVTGGPRTVTFSAWSWERYLRGKAGAMCRVRLVDAINLSPGHCADAWRSHRTRGLIAGERLGLSAFHEAKPEG